MARRAKAAGMRILLDPHYSDFWADPQKQPIPASWPRTCRRWPRRSHDYTRDALDALVRAGHAGADAPARQRDPQRHPVADGPARRQRDQWDRLGTLLRAAAAGARDAKGPTPRLVVHYDQGGDNGGSRWFYDNIVAQHVPFDVIGLSYYPFWHGTLSQLRTNVDDLAQRYHRDVSVVETQYGWTLDNGDQESNFLWTPDLLVPGYPATPGGQLGFASDLESILAAVPGGRGLGVFYWQPEWIPGIGWQPGAGTPNDNLTLFDFTGHALPGVSFADPLRACAQLRAGVGRRLPGLGGGAARQDAADRRALDEHQRPRAGIAVDAVEQVGRQRRVRRGAHDEHRVVGALQQDGAILAEREVTRARAPAGEHVGPRRGEPLARLDRVGAAVLAARAQPLGHAVVRALQRPDDRGGRPRRGDQRREQGERGLERGHGAQDVRLRPAAARRAPRRRSPP